MSPLKVSDLKPGDVVRIEFTVYGTNGGVAWVAHRDQRHQANYASFSDEDLAAGNAELVVRPRPVRKGDIVLDPQNDSFWTFIAAHGHHVLLADANDTPELFDGEMRDALTHADGSPIDWAASE